ncbi:MAG: FIST N-terminal domain-containing protein [Actinomycetota bacterium]
MTVLDGESPTRPDNDPNVGIRIATSASDDCRDAASVSAIYEQLVERLGAAPDLVIAYTTSAMTDSVDQWLDASVPAAVIGATSCQQIMTDEGVFGATGAEHNRAIGLLGISDPGGAYGVAIAPIEGDGAQAACAAFSAALTEADRPGELPELVILHAASGTEEIAIAAIDGLTGGNCPIVGATPADDGPNENSSCHAGRTRFAAGVAVAVCFPSRRASTAFQGGYVPTGHRGVVTSVSDMVIHQIDGRPAAEVFNHWVDGAFDEALAANDGQPFAETTTWCLSREVDRTDVNGSSVPHYALFDSGGVTDDHGLKIFVGIEEGQLVHLMTGNASSLPSRSAHVINAARADRMPTVAGGLVSYCAGYRFAPEVDLDDVHHALADAFDRQPFLLMFAFGEQGSLLSDASLHGNLMVSAATFDGG